MIIFGQEQYMPIMNFDCFFFKWNFDAGFYIYQSELQDIRPRLPQLEHHLYYSIPNSVKILTTQPVHDFYERFHFGPFVMPLQ